MAGTSQSLDPIARTQIMREELQRVIASATFRNSEGLRKLLSYLADSAFEDEGETIKAKDIATAVFNRSDDFDSQSDSVVRVQVGRLRAKLAEHYVEEASDSEWVLTIPKGSYQLYCHPRRHAALRTEPVEPTHPAVFDSPPAIAPQTPAQVRTRYPLVALAAITAVLVACAFWAGRFSIQRADAGVQPKGALAAFWQPFAITDPPLIVFSNQRLVGSVHAMHVYSNSGEDRGRPLIQSWTTVGEVIGVFDVTKSLALFRKPPPLVKPAHLLSWDDARNRSLIVVGGPLSETVDINLFRDFRFENASENAAIPAETGAIVDLKPAKGQPALYLGPSTRPFDFDYALISLQPSLTEGHEMLTMAGITEYGTQAAAEFLTQDSTIEKLASRLGVAPGRHFPSFEALLRVRIQDDVPLQSTIVTVRRY